MPDEISEITLALSTPECSNVLPAHSVICWPANRVSWLILQCNPSAYYTLRRSIIFELMQDKYDENEFLFCANMKKWGHNDAITYPTVQPIFAKPSQPGNFVNKLIDEQYASAKNVCGYPPLAAKWSESKGMVWKYKIAYATFHYWYKRFRTADATDNKDIRANGFVQLVVDDHHAGVCYCELAFADGKKLLFHQPVSAEFLKALLNWSCCICPHHASITFMHLQPICVKGLMV